MNERDNLLQAILNNPYSDMHRLVFSDWLEEEGELDRAEFIRVQIELVQIATNGLSKTISDCVKKKDGAEMLHLSDKMIELRRRERELLEKHGTLWLSGLFNQQWISANEPDHCMFTTDNIKVNADATFGRGFVESVSCRSQEWFQYANWILAEHPIRRVKLTTWPQWFTSTQPTWPGIKFEFPRLEGIQS